MNLAGGAPSRERTRFGSEFISALLRDFRQGGPAAIAKVRKYQLVSSAQADLLHCKHDDLPWWGARARFEKRPEAARRLVNKALLADMAVRCGLPWTSWASGTSGTSWKSWKSWKSTNATRALLILAGL
jgi:hypothetical protein